MAATSKQYEGKHIRIFLAGKLVSEMSPLVREYNPDGTVKRGLTKAEKLHQTIHTSLVRLFPTGLGSNQTIKAYNAFKAVTLPALRKVNNAPEAGFNPDGFTFQLVTYLDDGTMATISADSKGNEMAMSGEWFEKYLELSLNSPFNQYNLVETETETKPAEVPAEIDLASMFTPADKIASKPASKTASKS